jgi:hypothetical protein
VYVQLLPHSVKGDGQLLPAHEPATQSCADPRLPPPPVAPPHAREQLPQWVGSLERSTQPGVPGQLVVPLGQCWQRPWRQLSSWSQTRPQMPQLVASLSRFTQRSPHTVVPPEHWLAHADSEQNKPSAHWTSHAPQCELLVASSKHTPPQSVDPSGQARPPGDTL